MGSIELWKIGAALGVPGLALIVFVTLMRKFSFKFPMVPRKWTGPIVVLFLVLLGAITLTALVLFSPSPERAPAVDPGIELRQVDYLVEMAENDWLEARNYKNQNVPTWEKRCTELEKLRSMKNDPTASELEIKRLRGQIEAANNRVEERWDALVQLRSRREALEAQIEGKMPDQ